MVSRCHQVDSDIDGQWSQGWLMIVVEQWLISGLPVMLITTSVTRRSIARPPDPGDCGDEVIASGQKASKSMSSQLRAYR